MKLFNLGTIAAVAALTLSLSAPSQAQTYPVEGGRTYVTLSSEFAGALGSLGVFVGPIGKGRVLHGVASFPINGGSLDVANATGEVTHKGGLFLTAGTTSVRLMDFNIELTGTPGLTGLVVANGTVVGRIRLFDIALPAGITLPLAPANGRFFDLMGARVTLSGTAATALNGVFGVSAFAAGFPIGMARVSAFLDDDIAAR
ncbi:MAG: hypothetical protein NW208_18145 [Bryobacter sp.]|nr:hypothetical protein [Bryobacter sp.]